MKTRILYLFTRTPLHVGAGSSVGAIDQPVIRERHTGFPVVPASSLKGTFADEWTDGTKRTEEGKWLFGSDDANAQCAGSILFTEARLLAFPIRSAKGSYAWITCPSLLQKARRDGVIALDAPAEPGEDQAIFKPDGPLALPGQQGGPPQIVLEDYCFSVTGTYPAELANALAGLVADEVFKSIAERLVIVSNGTMSHFATTACEVAQHVRISDETGTAEGTGLFNQENVPADTLFYAPLHFLPERKNGLKTEDDAAEKFAQRLQTKNYLFQFGGDASTGLGFCSVALAECIMFSEMNKK